MGLKQEMAARLSELVNRLIYEKKVTNMKDFAEKCDLNYPGLVEARQGKRRLSTEMLISICNTFDISADWLLLGREKNHTPDQSRMERLEDRTNALFIEVERIKQGQKKRGKNEEKSKGLR